MCLSHDSLMLARKAWSTFGSQVVPCFQLGATKPCNSRSSTYSIMYTNEHTVPSKSPAPPRSWPHGGLPEAAPLHKPRAEGRGHLL